MLRFRFVLDTNLRAEKGINAKQHERKPTAKVNQIIRIEGLNVMATQAAVETKQEPKVVADAGLMKLYRDYDKGLTKTTGYFAAVVRYAKEHKLSRGSIAISLKEVRPTMAQSTIDSEVSRIIGMCKPEYEEILEQMEAGKITQTEARSLVTKKQTNPANKKQSEEEKLRSKIFVAAKYAIKYTQLTDEEDDEDTANEEAEEAFVEICKEEFANALKSNPLFDQAGEGGEEGESEEDESEAA
jgi:hypothetical protein